jgi:hypothetical protein
MNGRATSLTTRDLVRDWPFAASEPARTRVARFLADAVGEEAMHDGLGARHQRLLRMHQELVRRPIDACVVCPHCGTDNEFPLPVEHIIGLPTPPPGATVEVATGDGYSVFRIPAIADIADISAATDGLSALARRTRVGGHADALTSAEMDLLAEAWEALDPAGSLRIELVCAECAHELVADADVNEFVARDFDLLVQSLMREVHTIAGAYGWAEAEILDLPAERRRWYVDLIGRSSGTAQRHLVAVST